MTRSVHRQHRQPRRGGMRTAMALVLAGAAAVLGVSPAHAHTDLLGSSPAAGDQVSPATEELTLAFADEVVPGAAAVSVVGPDGQEATSGTTRAEGTLVRVGLRLVEAGEHTVSYRVVAADGHVVTGRLLFVVTAGASVPSVVPPAPPSTPDPEGPRPLTWVMATTVLLLLLAGLHAARRRRTAPRTAPAPAPEAPAAGLPPAART